MNGFRYRLYRFMQGRRGIDQFCRFLLLTAMILLFLSMFPIRIPYISNGVYYIGIILFIYGYFRAFSKNLYQREKENNWFLAMRYRITRGKTFRQRYYERKYYTYFKCPGCGQKMRAPKGRGMIRVKCHNCDTQFTRKV